MKHIFGLCPISGTELLKHLEFSVMRAIIGVFCYVNEVAFGNHLRMRAGCQESQPLIRGLEFSTSLQEGERGCRLNQLPTADDLINQVYVMKPS